MDEQTLRVYAKFMSANVNPKLAKLVALMRSTNHPGERASVRVKAEALAAAEGKTLERVIAELDYEAVRQANPTNPFAGFDEWQEILHPGHQNELARKRLAWFEAWRIRKTAVVAKYGCEEAALEPLQRERLILDAVRPWRIIEDPPYQRWTKSLDGWSNCFDRDSMPPHISIAIQSAYPLPTSYRSALTEVQFWQDRNQELEDLLADDSGLYGADYGLDLPMVVRLHMVERLADRDLRVDNLEDLITRFELYHQSDTSNKDVEAALLRDLKAIAGRRSAH